MRILKVTTVHRVRAAGRTTSAFSLDDGVTLRAEALGVVLSTVEEKPVHTLIPWAQVLSCEVEFEAAAKVEEPKKGKAA